MVKVLIADDEASVRDALGQMLSLYCPNAKVVATADGVEACIKAINQFTPDVVLLDIQMKDGTGFTVLKSFPNPSFKVIFVTAYEQYAVEAFHFSALDYLLKPLDPDLLVSAINKAVDVIDREKIALKIDSFLHNMESLSKGSKKVVLKTADTIHVVNLQDIIYCEADRSYTNFFLADKTKIMVTRTLGDFEDMFHSFGFLRIHQSYLVNINFVKTYQKGEGGTVVLSNGAQLAVATRKKEYLLQMLSKL